MGCVIAGVVVAILLAGVTLWAGVHLLGLVLMLLIAGLIGAGADRLVPGTLPGGWVGAVLAGILGGFAGNLILRPFGMAGFGPSLFGIDLIPAFVGAVAITGIVELAANTRSRGRGALPPGRRD